MPNAEPGRAARLLGWRGAIAATLIVPTGAAIAIGALASTVIEPRWTAGGLAYATGYPKNVEITATLVAVALGALTALCARWPVAWLAALVLAAGGYAYAARTCAALTASVWVPVLVPALMLAAGLERLHAKPSGSPPHRAERVLAAASMAALTAALFVMSVPLLSIDAFHHGEVLASALDLLAGGRPFVTFIWPHGLHDTGVAALWILLTGKIGTSPVALTGATISALAAPTLYLLMRRALHSAAATALACWLAITALIAVAADWAVHPWAVLPMLGTWFWFAAALHLALSDSAIAAVLAGGALAVGHLFRIDASLFASAAVVAAVVHQRVIAPADETWRHRARQGMATLATMACSAAAVLAALRLVLGWPERHWFHTVFYDLPRYHGIASGLPFPWPCGARPVEPATASLGVGLLVLATVLLAAALRRLTADRRGQSFPPPTTPQVSLLVFLAAFAFLSLRSALGRSDLSHFYWTWPILLVSALLCASPWLMQLGGRPWRTAALLAAIALAFARAAEPSARGHVLALIEHLRANAPVGACADIMFTADEATQPLNAAFIDGTCRVEHELGARGIRQLLIDHSAPWYYIRFHMPQPSSYYSLNRAYSAAAQQQLIADIRAARAQALLRVTGYGSIAQYDVPNVYRIPIVEAYLRARRRSAPILDTPLGRLYLWDEPDAPAAQQPDAGDAPRRTLPALWGAEWRDLPAMVDAATALGTADRAAATAR